MFAAEDMVPALRVESRPVALSAHPISSQAVDLITVSNKLTTVFCCVTMASVIPRPKLSVEFVCQTIHMILPAFRRGKPAVGRPSLQALGL
jgi:hypothetical protein